MIRLRTLKLGGCCLPLIFSSCAVFQLPSGNPDNMIAAQLRAAQPVPTPGELTDRWWTLFNDEDLNGLIGAALSNNTTLAQTEARLNQALALLKQREAVRYPDLNLEGAAGVTRREKASGGTTSRDTESYRLGLAAGYEVDLWGRVAAGVRSAEWSAAAQQSDWETAAMTLSAEVALRYFELLSSRQTQDLLKKQLKTNQETLDVIDKRFDAAQASVLDVWQQMEVVLETSALIPLQTARQETLKNELGVLLGRSPSEMPPVVRRALPTLPPIPDADLVSHLLIRRPDVEAAWRRLGAAEWEHAAALADRLPSLRVTADGQYADESASKLFDNWLLNLAGNIAAPVIDFGRRKAEVERQRSVVDERVANYRGTVLNAIREVKDALALESGRTRNLAFAYEQLELSGKSREEAFQRFMKGQESYLRVITAVLGQERLHRTVVQSELELALNRVRLYRALGGDWRTVLAERAAEEVEE